MTVDRVIDELIDELRQLKARLVVDDEMMEHLLAIYRIAFVTWYDADSEEHRKWGEELWPHISALNHRLGFKK